MSVRMPEPQDNAVDSEAKTLAIGRILGMMQRPYQDGDVEEYYRCRGIILDLSDEVPDHRPDWSRDRLKGAQGQ